MDNYVAIVADNDTKAYDGLHALWELDNIGDITVHGAVVLHRDEGGSMDVATKQTDPGSRTAIAIGIGTLLGALAAYETGFVLPRGKSAIIAVVSEVWTTPIDNMAKQLGVVYRRPSSSVRSDYWTDDEDYLYPYDYDPVYA